MRDRDCCELLQWALPRMRLRWAGFRKVRSQVCKRIGRRLAALGLEGPSEYRRLLESSSAEWEVLDGLCRVTVSRFLRDRDTFDLLGARLLPALGERAAARSEAELRVWSAGCACGEEPYSLVLVWQLGPAAARDPRLTLRVLASDCDPLVLERARRACYRQGSVRGLPAHWLRLAFRRAAGQWCLRPTYRRKVELRQEDIRREMPEPPLDLILCRNLAFTYFEPTLQEEIAQRIHARLRVGGYLVIGAHEQLPATARGFAPVGDGAAAFERL